MEGVEERDKSIYLTQKIQQLYDRKKNYANKKKKTDYSGKSMNKIISLTFHLCQFITLGKNVTNTKKKMSDI